MNTLGYVKQVVRSLNGDPDGDWLDDAYLNPMVNHVYRLQINYLATFCSTSIMRVVEIPAIPAGTTDLSKWQAQQLAQGPGPLYGLRDVFEVEWKQAGQPATQYREAPVRGKLPDVLPGSSIFRMWHEWRSYVIYITPLIFAADFRVRGDFSPPALTKDTDPIVLHPDLGDCLAEEVSACVQRERGNDGHAQPFQLVGTAALDDIATQIVHGGQDVPVRIGKITRRRR